MAYESKAEYAMVLYQSGWLYVRSLPQVLPSTRFYPLPFFRFGLIRNSTAV